MSSRRRKTTKAQTASANAWADAQLAEFTERVKAALLREPMTHVEIERRWNLTPGQVDDTLARIRERHANLVELGGSIQVLRDPVPATHDPAIHQVVSDADGRYRFGVISDTHYGSKHCREEVVGLLYDWYAKEGVQRVYHCGNWVEGEARFNKHELVPGAHGMQEQIDYMVARYPRRRGITTYYVAGDDHEGWWAQREGVDVGRLLEQTARHAGREDLVYLGYKEAFIRLEHAKTKRHARMLVDHPGGGTAYALSYAAQKRVEAAQSGEKPAVWLFGHWHKMGYFVTRGVHVVLVPSTKDQDTFGRKKGLEYVIGGAILDMRQGEGGAVEEVVPRFRTFYDRGYYNQQFSLSGPVQKVPA